MEQCNTKRLGAKPSFYFNPFALEKVILVTDDNGLPRLSVNDVIFDLARGMCPPRFTDWFIPKYAEYRGRLPWKYQPEYAQLPGYDLAMLEDYLHFLEIGFTPSTEIWLYFFLHAMDWGKATNVVFRVMQKEVDALQNRKRVAYADKEMVIRDMIECVHREFEDYLTIDTNWVMDENKKLFDQVYQSGYTDEEIDKQVNPEDFLILAEVKDRAGHPIPDLYDVWYANKEGRMLPGYIMNPYDFREVCPMDETGAPDYDLLTIVPEYVPLKGYDMEGMVADLRALGITNWRDVCVFVHLSNYGWKDSPVRRAMAKLKARMTNPHIPGKVTTPSSYLRMLIDKEKAFRIAAPMKIANVQKP